MIYYDLLPPRAICRRVSEGQYVVGSVVKGGAFCRGDNLSCSPQFTVSLQCNLPVGLKPEGPVLVGLFEVQEVCDLGPGNCQCSWSRTNIWKF